MTGSIHLRPPRLARGMAPLYDARGEDMVGAAVALNVQLLRKLDLDPERLSRH